MKCFSDIIRNNINPADKISAGHCFYGLFGAGKAFFLNEILEESKEKMLIVAKSELSARKFYEDFCFLQGRDNVILVEPAEYMLYDAVPAENVQTAGRTAALYRMIRGDYRVAVISPSALIERLPYREVLEENSLKIVQGQEYDPISVVGKLSDMGYHRVPKTEEQGQYSLRGDILDVFPYGSEMPFRTEFFDMLVENIRVFDPLLQKTGEETDKFEALPLRESSVLGLKACEGVKLRMTHAGDLCRNPGLRRRVYSDAERIVPGTSFRGSDRYIYFYLGEGQNIFDYAGDIFTVAEETEEIRNSVLGIQEDHCRICDSIRDTMGILKETYRIYGDPEYSLNLLENRRGIELKQFGEEKGNNILIRQREISSITENNKNEAETLLEATKKGKTVIYYADSEERAKRLREMLRGEGVPVTAETSETKPGVVTLQKGGLSTSFEFGDANLEVITENALSGQYVSRKKKKSKKVSDNPLTFSDLAPGDIVVHDAYGIGRYEGIVSIETDGVRGDYIKIIYRDNGKIYVPAHKLSEIRKYIGNDGENPVLNSLGGYEWEKMKRKVKDSLKVYARELVELYAKRASLKGYAFSPDTEWQKEFEEDFAYEETPDQLKCVREIKADMEMERPMDRLLCGDVGYGKTEVALRAAFKAVCDGKQVIFLVPTTVLAMQHMKTFTERFKKYPVKIACMCRLNSEKEKKKTAEDLKKGYVDILVGTHSVILRKLNFKNPGLLIIDEEQRFGVKQKEKIKELYPGIDILTLSATPIPRTLHMSLSGIRDISIIEDPPVNRTPVKTYVAEWDPVMVRNAIYREMGRKGQIFYLHNNVETLEEKRMKLREMVPEARICIGNGQMDERELENVITDFLDYKYDILLCTTIIESGVDMPNVNTVIVENGDRFGLSQLYQIRGRVGRSERSAYAYITYPGGKSISEVAEKRLRTIRDCTEFGAGFKIAMKDLEIRGAGSVLGERQHGQIAVVGYEMYCRLLNQVIEETKTGETLEITKPASSVDLKIPAYISESYIEDDESRVGIYRQIAAIESEEDIEELKKDLTDRYGKVPEETAVLMDISHIRYLAECKNVSSVARKGENIFVTLAEGASGSIFNEMGNNATKKLGGIVSVGVGKTPYLSIKAVRDRKEVPKSVILKEIKTILSF